MNYFNEVLGDFGMILEQGLAHWSCSGNPRIEKGTHPSFCWSHSMWD